MRLRPRHVTPRISLRDNETSTQDRKHRKNEVGQGWACEHGPHNILWSVIIIMGTCEQWPGFPCHDTVSRWQRAELRAKSEVSGHWESELWTPGPSSDRSQGRDAGCCGVQWAQNHGVTASQIEQCVNEWSLRPSDWADVRHGRGPPPPVSPDARDPGHEPGRPLPPGNARRVQTQPQHPLDPGEVPQAVSSVEANTSVV